MTTLPESARTISGIAAIMPAAMKTITKKGSNAPMLVASSGSPSDSTSVPAMPMIVDMTPAIMSGYKE